MSYQSWHEYGRGINFSEFEYDSEKEGAPITVEGIERLLMFAPKTQESVHNFLALRKGAHEPGWSPTKEDYEDWDVDYGIGLAYLVAEAIKESSGFEHVLACADFDCDHYIIFSVGYPWEMSEAERNISCDEWDKILHMHLLLLNPDAPVIHIDYLSIENGG